MVVTEKNFDVLINDLIVSPAIGFDVETYGLGFHDRLFSLALATANESYYLNFNYAADHLGNYPKAVLPRDHLRFLDFAFISEDKLWLSHNAAFDIQKLRLEGLQGPRIVHCSYVAERIIRNDSMDLSLEAVAKKYGYAKDMTVDKYIDEHKLYTQVVLPGKERKEKLKHFDKVPFEIISAYGETDARIHREVGLTQYEEHFGVRQ